MAGVKAGRASRGAEGHLLWETLDSRAPYTLPQLPPPRWNLKGPALASFPVRTASPGRGGRHGFLPPHPRGGRPGAGHPVGTRQIFAELTLRNE